MFIAKTDEKSCWICVFSARNVEHNEIRGNKRTMVSGCWGSRRWWWCPPYDGTQIYHGITHTYMYMYTQASLVGSGHDFVRLSICHDYILSPTDTSWWSLLPATPWLMQSISMTPIMSTKSSFYGWYHVKCFYGVFKVKPKVVVSGPLNWRCRRYFTFDLTIVQAISENLINIMSTWRKDPHRKMEIIHFLEFPMSLKVKIACYIFLFFSENCK